MRIVSTTLAGQGTEGLIVDALRSVVDWVDVSVVLQTSDDEAPVEAARGVCGDKLLVVRWDWRGDFAAARNACLDEAAGRGDWMITIDTDERIELRGEDVHAALAASVDDVIYVRDRDGSYSKDRFFRLPARHRWSGAFDEAYPQIPGGHEEMRRARFWEVPKTAEQLRRKFEAGAAGHRRLIEAEPANGRWWYYLGSSLAGLGQTEEAIVAFERAALLSRWDEERAWSCYRAASLYCELGRFDAAIDACAQGIGYRASTAELYWLAGWAAGRVGRFDDAIAFCHASAALGAFQGLERGRRRIGFSHRPALWEGPYDVLRAVYRAQGARDKEAAADALCRTAEKARHEAEG